MAGPAAHQLDLAAAAVRPRDDGRNDVGNRLGRRCRVPGAGTARGAGRADAGASTRVGPQERQHWISDWPGSGPSSPASGLVATAPASAVRATSCMAAVRADVDARDLTGTQGWGARCSTIVAGRVACGMPEFGRRVAFVLLAKLPRPLRIRLRGLAAVGLAAVERRGASGRQAASPALY
jgi:hypothetical protein